MFFCLTGLINFICTFTMFISICLSEPYLTIDGSLSELVTVTTFIHCYPTWIYSYLALLVPLFVITDLTRYKPVVVAYCASYVICYVIWLYGKGIELIKLMQIVYALATACEISFYSYPFNVLYKKIFSKSNLFCKIKIYDSQFIGSVVGQVLV